MSAVFEISVADPELAAQKELSVKLTWCPFSYDGLVPLPQAKRHLICFPFELSVYITWHFKKQALSSPVPVISYNSLIPVLAADITMLSYSRRIKMKPF